MKAGSSELALNFKILRFNGVLLLASPGKPKRSWNLSSLRFLHATGTFYLVRIKHF